MRQMQTHNAMRTLAPEAAKLGITWKSFGTGNGTRSARLQDRANIRRIVNAIETRPSESASAEDSEHRIEILDAAATLISDLNICLDEGDAGVAALGGGGTRGNALHDINGQRIGTLLNAAALRDGRSIAAALGVHDGLTLNGNGDNPPVAMAGEQGGLAAFFRGVAGGATTGAIRASLTEGTDSSGGYAVPSWVLAPIIRALVPASSMLQAGANMVVLDKPGDSFVIPAVATIPTPAWRLEAGALANAGPTFRAVTIVPRSLAFIFQVSRELLQDAPGMDDALSTVISQAFAKEIDRAGLIGSGTAPEIRGILNTTGVQAYSMGTNGAALADYSTIVKAKRLLADANAPAPNAIITSTREGEAIDLFADTLGQPLRRPPALESLQFVATTQIPVDDTQGTASDAASMYLGNFAQATFYMRERLSVLKLNELYAGTGMVGFACHARLDLALAYPAAFCVVKGVIPAA